MTQMEEIKLGVVKVTDLCPYRSGEHVSDS